MPAALAALQALHDEVNGNGDPHAQQILQWQVPTHCTRFRVLTAAGLIGGWWGSQAENDGGTALSAALQLLQECLGNEVTAVVRHVIRWADTIAGQHKDIMIPP